MPSSADLQSQVQRLLRRASCFILATLLAGPALALTPIGSADLSPDITVILDGQVIADQDVAADDFLSGIVTKPALGSLPEASGLSGYHALGGGEFLLVFDISVDLPGGVFAQPGDVVRYDGADYAIEFDASLWSIPAGVHTDAVTVGTSGNLILSFDTAVVISGSTYYDEDLVEFDGANFSSYFDGSSRGLAETLDIDGAHVFEGSGNLAVSFDTSGRIGGIDFDDEDVLEFEAAGPTWEMAWDASLERVEWEPGADVNAVYFVPEPSPYASLIAGGGLLALLQRKRLRTGGV